MSAGLKTTTVFGPSHSAEVPEVKGFGAGPASPYGRSASGRTGHAEASGHTSPSWMEYCCCYCALQRP